MAVWREDITTCSIEEVLRSQEANRAWSKELRNRTAALVNSRLANEISWGDYIENRKLADVDTAECRRRAGILQRQLPENRRGF